MEIIDNAGHAVLYSYGHFLDSLLLNLFNIKKSFTPINKITNPIEIQTIQKEHILIYDLIDTDSKSQNKILMVFTAICKEVEYLKYELENEFLNLILNYEEDVLEELTVEEVHIQFAKFLPSLLDILVFVRRCRQVLLHFLKQMFSIIKYPWPKDTQNIMYLKLQEVFIYFSDLLLLFVALDVALNCNEENKVAKHLNSFWQYIKLSSANKERGKINKVLSEINDELLTGNIFQATLHLLFEEKIFLSDYNNFPTHFNKYLKKKLAEIENSKENDISALYCWSRIVASHVFMVKCFGMTDKKNHRHVLELAKKFIVVPLYGDLVWLPGTFLAAQFDARGSDTNSKNLANCSFFYQRRLELVENNTSKDVKTYSFLVYKWSLQMENLMSPDASFSKLNEDLAQLCSEGIGLLDQLKFSVNNILQLHGSSGRPMTKISVLNLCKLIELIKGLQSVFCRHHIEIAKQMNHTIQKRIMQILSTVLRIKNTVFKSGLQEKYMDAYSSLLLIEKILYGACSLDRILIMRLALTIINHHPLLDLESTESVLRLINDLYELCLLHEKLENTSSVNFLFLEENVLPIYFKHVADSHSVAQRLQYLLQSMKNDPPRTEYENLRKDILKNKVIKELCVEIEVLLRLNAHAHLKDDASLEKINKNYHALLSDTPFGVYKWFITVKGLVESYLDETFYDLTTVALHDWQSYSEMKTLAAHQLKLETIEDNLPSQTISQGLDILEIMRNIHVFVSKYLYNLNTQCFVEFTSANKHLNTIRIHQIANSIWTHGTGIMNTAVNFIYQFLRKKLLLCSQFLYDEHINSRLTKDFKYFMEQKLQKQALYPYERAEKFNKGISRLKISSDGLSYLDQYRSLISQIGNALGYVRMIRSGGLHHSIATVTYFPVMDYVNILERPREGTLAASNESFENTFYNSLHHLNVETDALKLLVEVFRTVFYSSENDHLRLFVMIIPPLTINFVHYIVTSKEKMSKRNSATGIFSDDGFAMGIAYLLSVFNLNGEFDSLHWFESVFTKYDSEIKKLCEAKDASNRDDTSQDNTMQLSIKRLQMYKKEFELLQYNLCSARVFFSGSMDNMKQETT